MADVPYTRVPRTTLWLLREGEVTIGDGTSDRPQFTVSVRPIYIGKAPITNDEYEAFDPAHRRSHTSTGDRDPVVGVSFADAIGYCRWYSAASSKDFRLPSEVEWEFACRGNTAPPYFWGSDPKAGDPHVWDAATSSGHAHPVETSRANPFGLHDLLGNVWEWTASLFLPYPVTDSDKRDDPSLPGPRVIRGGSFRTPRADLSSAARQSLDPSECRDDLGFRIARYL